MPDRERRIRDLAYRLWEEAGRPEGREASHWSEAEKIFETEAAGDAKGKKGSAKKDKASKASKAPKSSKSPEAVPKEAAEAAAADAGKAMTKKRGGGSKAEDTVTPAPSKKSGGKGEPKSLAGKATATGAKA